MMKTKTLLLSLTAALALSAAAPAWALETEWVATGTVFNGFDYSGVFGTAGTYLTGDAFTADFYIDTSKGTEDSEPGYSDFVYGGTDDGDDTPVVASLTINSITKSFSGAEYGQAVAQGGFSDHGNLNAESYTDGNNAIYTGIDNMLSNTHGFPTIIGHSFSLAASEDVGNDEYGYFQLYDLAGYAAYGDLQVNNISSAGVSAAPEPSAWALLIAGVGMVGATLRLGRRRGWAMA